MTAYIKEVHQMANGIDLESTDYDVDRITNYDFRFEENKKDCIFFHGIGGVAAVIATIVMYALGSSDPTQQKYFLGYPTWVSVPTLIYLGMYVIGNVYVARWKLWPLTAKYKGGK